MQDSINEEHADEIDGTVDDLFIVTFQFLYKTYIFSGPDKANYGTNIIPKISTYISAWPAISTIISDGVSVDISVEVSAEVSTDIDVIYDGFVP